MSKMISRCLSSCANSNSVKLLKAEIKAKWKGQGLLRKVEANPAAPDFPLLPPERLLPSRSADSFCHRCP